MPELRYIKLCWQPNVSDRGVAALAACNRRKDVDRMGTFTGDGALRALIGKPALRQFKTGRKPPMPASRCFTCFRFSRPGRAARRATA